MSRIGKKPIEMPKGVDIKIDGPTVIVKGPKGELKRTFNDRITIAKDGNIIELKRSTDERNDRALHGLSRALLANMVSGVATGFNKVLEITESSTGYRAEMKGKDLELFLGFSHSIPFPRIVCWRDYRRIVRESSLVELRENRRRGKRGNFSP